VVDGGVSDVRPFPPLRRTRRAIPRQRRVGHLAVFLTSRNVSWSKHPKM